MARKHDSVLAVLFALLSRRNNLYLFSKEGSNAAVKFDHFIFKKGQPTSLSTHRIMVIAIL